ncbi:MAG: response regulator [Spartobacteria bacterium]|nr:response regulator [Spartobacteria bacterium]
MNLGEKEQNVILLVDDHAANRHIVKAMLRSEPIILDAVENGCQALEYLRLRHCDLVLMDCQMPEMNGMDAARAIRAGECGQENVRIPIVAMTAHALDEDRRLCLDAGMDDYISKPIDRKGLMTTLNKWLTQSDEERDGGMVSAAAEKEAAPAVMLSHFDFDGTKLRLMDDLELIAIIVGSYLDEFPTQLKQLQQSVAADDVATAGKLGHRIKGSSSNVGAVLLQAQGLRIERAGKAGDMEEVKVAAAALPELFLEYSKVVKQLLPLD